MIAQVSVQVESPTKYTPGCIKVPLKMVWEPRVETGQLTIVFVYKLILEKFISLETLMLYMFFISNT